MARIAVVNVPFYSHVRAATRLTSVLVRQGHSVVSWAPEWAREWIEDAGAEFELHTPPMPKVKGTAAFIASLASTTEAIVGDLIEGLFAAGADLVVHDSQVPWARVAAEYLGLPRIVSHPMFPIVSPKRVSFDGEEAVPMEDPDEATAAFETSWLAIARQWGVELGTWDGIIHDTGAEKDATLAFTTERIVGKGLKSGWHCVGPLMDLRPRASEPPGVPLVYACFGTSFNRRPKQFTSVIEAVAEEPVEVVVSMGAGTIAAETLGALPGNVTVKEFVDAREVLSRASVHITHGGCNSVHESLLAGVPMLCIPQGYDQFPLTSRIAALGAGRVVLEDADAIRAGVHWLLDDEAPTRRARELGSHLAGYDGERRVADVFEAVLESAAIEV